MYLQGEHRSLSLTNNSILSGENSAQLLLCFRLKKESLEKWPLVPQQHTSMLQHCSPLHSWLSCFVLNVLKDPSHFINWFSVLSPELLWTRSWWNNYCDFLLNNNNNNKDDDDDGKIFLKQSGKILQHFSEFLLLANSGHRLFSPSSLNSSIEGHNRCMEKYRVLSA